jgi:hypothetical protein
MSSQPISDPRSMKLLKESAKAKRAKRRAFRPYAEQIGWNAYEWNRLQEALGELFSDILSLDSKRIVSLNTKSIGYAIWHSTDNERTLRNMLREAMKASKAQNRMEQRPYDDVSWILSQIEKLAGRRNAAIHAPFVMVSTSTSGVPAFEVVPAHFFGHPRAEELKDKSIPAEFKWYRDHLERLPDFAEELHFALIFQEVAWPDRPELPPRGQFESHTSPHRKSRSK